jgi:hypothetical protein
MGIKDQEKRDEERKMPEDEAMDEQPPIDPYTGEPEPLAEDAGKIVEIVPVDSGEHEGEEYLLEEEDALDKIAVDEDADAIGKRVARYTQEKDIRETFEERQKLAKGGRQQMEQELDEYNAQDPSLSTGDLDAASEDRIASGEESVGGSAPTPDQDIVDEIGGALGITYEDDEPLSGEEKLAERDRHRWELDPASAEEERESEE